MAAMNDTVLIGKVKLFKTAALAPMAGVADRAYRLMCKKYGAAYVVSEMVSAKGICYSDRKTAELCTITEPERPMGIQLFGRAGYYRHQYGMSRSEGRGDRSRFGTDEGH